MKNILFKKQQPKKPVPTFKQTFTLAERIEKRETLKAKYPQGQFCISVIEGLHDLPMDHKYPRAFNVIGLQNKITVLQLVGYLKKTIQANENMALFVEVGGTIPGMQTKIGELRENYTSDDGFLYFTLKAENGF